VEDAAALLRALSNWRAGDKTTLLELLGFEPVGLRVPDSGLPGFGLSDSKPGRLEVAARRGAFYVLRIVLSGGLDPEAIRETSGELYHHNPTRRTLLIFEAREDTRLVLASWGLGPGPFRLSKLWIDTAAPRRSELDILAALSVGDAKSASEIALAHVNALDRERITRRFFVEFRRHRAELAAGLAGLPSGVQQDRLDLALILLGRLLFLYFVQRKRWLGGDTAYIRHLYDDALDHQLPFYRARLKPLFFGALNRPPEKRSRAALDLGDLPFLNGGLFERVALERKYPRLDVPDRCFSTLLPDLLDRYQFTLREDQPADQDVAVDPEMLGRVFEGLMSGSLRESTGCYFTPKAVVDRLVDGALAAYLTRVSGGKARKIDDLIAGRPTQLDPDLHDRLLSSVRTLRVLDPAVGSGAFLLTALMRLERLRIFLEGRPPDKYARFGLRREIIQHNLFGVDVHGAAVRLCELRLWLAITVDLDVPHVQDVPPLPNLDLNIRQGDALVDPIEFACQHGDLDSGRPALEWQREVRRLATRRDRYFYAAGTGKSRRLRSIQQAEFRLACQYIGGRISTIDARRAELRAAACSRDLFGKRARLTRQQRKMATVLKRRRTELSRLLGRIRDLDELPFFSFPIHFADPDATDARFHLILGNPPWVRTHHWSGVARRRLKDRFHFLRYAGWRRGAQLAGAGRGFGAQVDLSLLFLERGLELLHEGGVLGLLLPSKTVRCLAASAARERLLRDTRILRLEDCSLATTRLFDATTYPLGLLIRREKPSQEAEVEVRVHDRHGDTLDFRLGQRRLPLLADDAESPWVLAPPVVRRVFDRIRGAGRPLGAQPGRRPTRGIFTGANSVFVGSLRGEVEAGTVKLDLPSGRVAIEPELLRPALCGEDVAAWRFRPSRALVWPYDDQGNLLCKLPPAAHSHLCGHRTLLARRLDLRPGQPYWSLFRVRPAKWALRVAWRDIAKAPEAVVIPPRVPFLRGKAPIISLNTVYQLAAASGEDAHLLAAVLNSTVARTYLRAIAERASGGYFRFLGWTVALLPFPERPDAAVAARCVEIGRRAHEAGGLDAADKTALDAAVASLYGLASPELDALMAFDSRLSSKPASPP
jgi:hypothetical protein